MDEAGALEKLDAAWLALKTPVTPIMGGTMLWRREVKRREEPLKENNELPEKDVPVLVAETMPIEGFGTIVSTRTTLMVRGIDEAKIVARKTASDIVNGFIDDIPDNGDELRSAIRINALLKEMGTLIRKHQVEQFTRLAHLTFTPKKKVCRQCPFLAVCEQISARKRVFERMEVK